MTDPDARWYKMAIISVRAEGEHERLLRESSNMYVLEPVLRALRADSWRWITQIDPYGDTVLNHLQISEFLHEWARLSAFATTEAESRALREVVELAEFCLEQPHRYLRFYGD